MTGDGTSVASAALHIDRARTVRFSAAGFSYDAAPRRCTGTCHGTGHNDVW